MATPKQIDKLRTATEVGVTISSATLIPAKQQDGTEAFKMSIAELSPFLNDKGLRIGTTGIISASLQDVKDAAATNTGIKLSSTTFEYTGIFTFASKTASTLIYLNASKQVTSLANAAGVLTNDGAGNFSYTSGSSQWITSGSDIYYDTGKVQVGNSTVGASKFNVYSASGAIMKLDCNTSTLDVELLTTVGAGYFGVNADALYFQALDSLSNGIVFYPNTAGTDQLRILSNGKMGIRVSAPTTNLAIKASSSSKALSAGGKDKEFYLDSGNLIATGETDLYVRTFEASLFGANGDTAYFSFTAEIVGAGVPTKRLRIYFGGTNVYDSTALVFATGDVVKLKGEIIRVSSTVVRVTVEAQLNTGVALTKTMYTEVTGLTLSNTNIFKLTGESSGVGSNNNDIVAKMGFIRFEEVSQ